MFLGQRAGDLTVGSEQVDGQLKRHIGLDVPGAALAHHVQRAHPDHRFLGERVAAAGLAQGQHDVMLNWHRNMLVVAEAHQ